MPVNLPFPIFANPPKEYDCTYMNDLVRSLGYLTTILGNPGEGRNTFIVLTNLQPDDQGLEAGSLYAGDNVVYISVTHIAAIASTSAALSLGDVTVSIT
jgi:hypothetical protein